MFNENNKLDQLVEKYPHVFKLFFAGKTEEQKEKGGFWGCQVWGFECGEGWAVPIEKCAQRLEEEILKQPEDKREHYHAVQVKEKFGGLRFYMRASTDEMEKIIRDAEEECAKLCEGCGQPGEFYNEGWCRTSCEPCQLKWRERTGRS